MAAAIPPLSAPARAAGFPPEPGTPQCDTFAPQCDTFAVRPARAADPRYRRAGGR